MPTYSTAMIIRRITVHHFGGVDFFETTFSPEINVLTTRHTPEISAAIAILLCDRVRTFSQRWIHSKTRLMAEISLGDQVYAVGAAPGKRNSGALALKAIDRSGNDVTREYRHALLHCPEQDATEHFDGQDRTLPLRLCRYYDDEPEELSVRTEYLSCTATFRRHLKQYIRAFTPEPINNKNQYMASVSEKGAFQVTDPTFPGRITLSETERRLFRYTCFLNIAEFWASMQEIRDLHHEKKPLMIQNFLEFLDESADISALIERTKKLQRQILILTTSLPAQAKWLGAEK